MRTPIFKGAGTAIITPFSENGIDFDKFAELIEFQITDGIDSIIVCGTTGEASTMPDSEHKAAVKFVVKQVNKRVPVIAGAGSNDTSHAIELSQYCESVGVDAVLSVSPYYNKTSQHGLYEHFKTIASAINIPIILYNIPARTGLNIEPDTLAKLSKISNIVGVKECNLPQVLLARSICEKDFAFYSGNDDQILPLLSLGGLGVISVISNILPGKTSMIVKDYLNGNTTKSLETYIELGDLIRALALDVNPIPIKQAMNIMGMNVGKYRLPLVDMEESNIQKLKDTLMSYRMIQEEK